MKKILKVKTKRFKDYNDNGWEVQVTETYDNNGKLLSRIMVEI